MSKFIIFLCILVVAIAVYINIQGDQSPQSVFEVENTVNDVDTINGVPIDTIGYVAGRLCFPSQFIPEGVVEAKNLETANMHMLSYPGSDQGGGDSYTIELPEGSYHLRFVTASEDESNGLNGYHTVECPTGAETGCSGQSPRTNIAVSVVTNQVTENVDLCDFYYAEEFEPSF